MIEILLIGIGLISIAFSAAMAYVIMIARAAVYEAKTERIICEELVAELGRHPKGIRPKEAPKEKEAKTQHQDPPSLSKSAQDLATIWGRPAWVYSPFSRPMTKKWVPCSLCNGMGKMPYIGWSQSCFACNGRGSVRRYFG